MFTPAQMVFLAAEIKRASALEGTIIEAGCAYGGTTIFLAKYLEELGSAQAYVAIDTFSGFLPEHTEYEISHRGKGRGLHGAFSTNDEIWFRRSLTAAGITNVRVVQADASRFDYDSLSPVAFALLDIDLYLPVRDALPRIYAALGPDGTIVVDDCKPGGPWDGALQAYEEFCEANGLQQDIRHEKLGIIGRAEGS
ncbi:MAG: TylF/MycF/NovP-related O-methyltransferase [Alphaproteobacteria bacterium]